MSTNTTINAITTINPVDFVPNYVAPRPIKGRVVRTNIPTAEFNKLIGKAPKELNKAYELDEIKHALDDAKIVYVSANKKGGDFIYLYSKEQKCRVLEIWVDLQTYVIFTRKCINNDSKYHESYNLQYETHFKTRTEMLNEVKQYVA